MGPPSYMQSVVDRNVVMRRTPVLRLGYQFCNSPFYLVFCYLLVTLTLSTPFSSNPHNKNIRLPNTIAAVFIQKLHS